VGEKRNACETLVGKTERKRPLGRPRRRGKDSIKIDLKELVCEDVDWIQLAQYRDQCQTCERGNEPSSSINGG
jgi:hypothetical protein